MFNDNRNTDRGVDIIQVRLGQAPSEKAAIDVALSIMIRDNIGDLLSMISHPQIPLSNSIPDGSLGHGHPNPPILEDSNPMDVKARSSLLSLPHTPDDNLHHNDIIRVSGLENHGQVDPIWLTFWQLLSAEVGLILTAMTAFRTLCVARVKERRSRSPESVALWDQCMGILRRLPHFKSP